MPDRRVENRFACADLVRVDWWEDEQNSHSGEGVLEDISKIGACVQVEEPIAAGAAIAISFGGLRLFGTACYCVYRDYGYFVGVEFSEDSMWSDTNNAPAHLTDLREIALLALESHAHRHRGLPPEC
jgi:hypothetical protein